MHTEKLRVSGWDDRSRSKSSVGDWVDCPCAAFQGSRPSTQVILQAVCLQGKPTDNGFIEAFNSKFRAKGLNAHWFSALADTRKKLEDYRSDYNEIRPHSAIGYNIPVDIHNPGSETSLQPCSEAKIWILTVQSWVAEHLLQCLWRQLGRHLGLRSDDFDRSNERMATAIQLVSTSADAREQLKAEYRKRSDAAFAPETLRNFRQITAMFCSWCREKAMIQSLRSTPRR